MRDTNKTDSALNDERDDINGTDIDRGNNDGDENKNDQLNNIDSLQEEEEKDLELVRFQFDGDLRMTVSIDEDTLTCSNYSTADYGKGDSFHVVEYMTVFMVRTDFKYEIIKDLVECTYVDDDLKLNIVNQVGVDSNAGFEAFFAGLPNTTQAALEYCKDGCQKEIKNKDAEGKYINAHFEDAFATGRPNIASPYTKNILFSVQGGTVDVSHSAAIAVEGRYSKGPGESYALPTHEPIVR